MTPHLVLLPLTTVALLASVGSSQARCRAKPRACVKEVRISSGTNQSATAYQYEVVLADDPRCSPGNKTLRVVLLRCGKKNTARRHKFAVNEVRGHACLPEGQWRAKLQGVWRGVCSQCFTVPSKDIAVEYYFRKFDTTGIELVLKTDPRISSWNLTVFNCTSSHKLNHYPRIGNSSYLSVAADFMPDVCYCFRLAAISYDGCPLFVSREKFTSNDSCFPGSPFPPGQPVCKTTAHWYGWWVAGAAVLGLLLLAVVVVTATAAASKLRLHPHHNNIRRDVTCPAAERGRAAGRGAGLLVVHDGGHSEVGRLCAHLRHELHLSVLDILAYDDADKIADPNGWLLSVMCAASTTKVLLVLTPAITRMLQDILSDNEVKVTTVQSPAAHLHSDAALVVAALQRLLHPDMKTNYHRLFVVSVEGVSGEEALGPDLLCSSRRFQLPLHWSSLVATITASPDNHASTSPHQPNCTPEHAEAN